MYKIIGADGKEYGPVSADQIRQWIKDGRLNAQSRIKPDGATDWQTLNTLPEFASDLTPAAGASPSFASTPPAGAAPAKTSGLAITSLVLGILGLFTCGLSAVLGLIFGIVALVKINKSQGQLGGKGLAIAGTVTSGILMLLLPLFAAMLIPALAKARERAQSIQCQNNLRQLGLAALVYATDNNDQLPSASNWCDALQANGESPKVFQCPTDSSLRCAFAYNANLAGLKLEEVDSDTVLFIESSTGWNAAGGMELFDAHKHSRRRVNVAFVDGSTRQVALDELDTLQWEP